MPSVGFHGTKTSQMTEHSPLGTHRSGERFVGRESEPGGIRTQLMLHVLRGLLQQGLEAI
jgi:hypothetical protein